MAADKMSPPGKQGLAAASNLLFHAAAISNYSAVSQSRGYLGNYIDNSADRGGYEHQISISNTSSQVMFVAVDYSQFNGALQICSPAAYADNLADFPFLP
jgi:hypothetical protein